MNFIYLCLFILHLRDKYELSIDQLPVGLIAQLVRAPGVWTKPGPRPGPMGYPMGYPVGHPQFFFFFLIKIKNDKHKKK